MVKYKRILLKLSGESLMGEKQYGIDETRLGEYAQQIKEIHELGVRLALDDFGTGYSSLSYLSEFPLDAIKIDRAFVEGLGRGDPSTSAIADAIAQIGRALSLLVVAEAVSTETQLQMVRDLGCSMAQGFLISPPLSVEQATDFVKGSGLPDLTR